LKKEEAKEQLQLQPPPEGAVLIKTNFNFPLENFQSPLIFVCLMCQILTDRRKGISNREKKDEETGEERPDGVTARGRFSRLISIRPNSFVSFGISN